MFSVEHLNALRSAEMEKIVTYLRPVGARVLEVGAGTGQQALELERRGFEVEAIEIASSNYAQYRLFGITAYDGRHIPCADASFDIVFSSNVLEHLPDLAQMHKEIRRVLKPTGYAVHVLPTLAWRFWTTVSAFPTAFQYAGTVGDQLKPRWSPNGAKFKRRWGAWYLASRHLLAPFGQQRHGERGNIISETWLFHPRWWRRNFRANGFDIIKDEPMGLFYTGNMTFNKNWSPGLRARLARVLASASHIFELKVRAHTAGATCHAQ